MKVLLRILGIIAVLVALGMGTLGVKRNLDDAKDAKEMGATIEQYQKEVAAMKEQVKALSGEEATAMNEEIEKAEKMLEIPSSGTFTMAAVFIVILMLLSIISAVFLFKAGHKAAVGVFGISVIVGIAAIVMAPKIEANEFSGISNHIIAMIVAIPTVLVALFAFIMRNGNKPAQVV